MIKKLIGLLVAAAVIAIIVMVVLRRDNFQSMVLCDEPTTRSVAAQGQLPAEPVTRDVVDSLTGIVSDSI